VLRNGPRVGESEHPSLLRRLVILHLTTTQNARASFNPFPFACVADKTIIYDRAQLKNTHGRRSPHYEALGYKFILIVPAASLHTYARERKRFWLLGSHIYLNALFALLLMAEQLCLPVKIIDDFIAQPRAHTPL
jgi:hypothetical protein